MHCVLTWLNGQLAGRSLAAAGHPIVHGGPVHGRPAVVSPELLDGLEQLVPLAPLHAPSAIAVIRAVAMADPNLTQVACFDTAFHRTNPRVAQAFAIPKALFDGGLRRYGFHGLSYEYIASVLPEVAPEIAEGRVVVAHLGNGASLCGLLDRVSQASTMGFSTLCGVPMGTRSGDLDPGAILYLLQSKGYTPERLERLLYKESGMLGLSGVSSDFKELTASSNPAQRSPSRSSYTGLQSRSLRSRRRSGAWTASCFQAGSASTPPACARQSAAAANGWAWRSTLLQMRLITRASARGRAGPPPMSYQLTRNG